MKYPQKSGIVPIKEEMSKRSICDADIEGGHWTGIGRQEQVQTMQTNATFIRHETHVYINQAYFTNFTSSSPDRIHRTNIQVHILHQPSA